MRIAQIAPLYESCPPKMYGGTERVVSFLTEELVRQGHDVTLFASGDSVTSARLEAGCARAIRLDESCRDPLARHFVMLHRVKRMASRFDVLHFHTDYLHFPMFEGSDHPLVTTLHGRLDLQELPEIYREFTAMKLVSISDAQRLPLAWANWVKTVHHGLPRNLLRQGDGTGEYLAFIGRISPEKRPDRAIEIARRAGVPLKIAAKVDKVDAQYFAEVVEPLIDGASVEFIGEIGDAEKQDFLGRAAALLFPIDWPEPFGLVMIEAMATGTPVVAYPCGSVPEVLEHGLTGLLVADQDAAVAAVDTALALDRGAIRRRFEERFTAERMAADYLALYRQLGASVPLHSRDRPTSRFAAGAAPEGMAAVRAFDQNVG